MFEYITRMDKKVTINPKMICCLLEGENGETSIYTCESSDPIIVKESYEKVKKQFEHFNYQMHTVVKM